MEKYTATGLLSNLIGVQLFIKFNVELKKEGTIPFLDTRLQWRDDSSLYVTVTGSSHTLHDPYTGFPYSPTIHLMSWLVRCSYDRARRINCTWDTL